MQGQLKWVLAFVVGLGLIVLGWRVPYLLTTVHVLVCFLLVVVVLLQSGKAADLAGAFGGAGSQTAFGPRGAATFLSKATTWCAVMFMVTSMALVLRQSKLQPAGSSVLQRYSKPAQQSPPTTPAPQPSAPQTAPGGPSSTTPAPQRQPSQQAPPAKPPARP